MAPDVRAGAAAGRPRSRVTLERGSAALEVALTLPLVVLSLTLVIHAGVLAADVVAAQGVAREAARVAAVADDAAVQRAAEHAAGERLVDVEVTPPDSRRSRGDQVTATIRLASGAFTAFGTRVEIPARATMLVEQ